MSDYLMQLLPYAFIAFLFLLAIGIYEILLFIVKRVIKKGSLLEALIAKIKLPILLLFLEFAAFITLDVLTPNPTLLANLQHLMSVLIIATIGFAMLRATRGGAHFLYEKYMEESKEDISKRSLATQVHILQYIAVILIGVLTLASILMTFPAIRALGIGLLGSAGILGLILGMAARPILQNLLVGFHIAFTKKIKIGDAVYVEDQLVRVESLYLTHVILKTWDGRRLYLPISHFVDKSFQNWSTFGEDIVATAHLYCDYTAPLSAIRGKFQEILQLTPLWNKRVSSVNVTRSTPDGMEIRFSMTTQNPFEAAELGNFVREGMIEFLQREHPSSFPRVRSEILK